MQHNITKTTKIICPICNDYVLAPDLLDHHNSHVAFNQTQLTEHKTFTRLVDAYDDIGMLDIIT